MAGQWWCNGCKHTGRVYGFDSSSPDNPTCFCPDGRTTPDTCLKGAAMFDLEYARWMEKNYKHMAELRGGLHAHLPDIVLRVIIDDCLTHYDEIFRLKGIAAKSNVFHLITGMWTTTAERYRNTGVKVGLVSPEISQT